MSVGQIEKSVPRITDLHHEACRVMTNADPEGILVCAAYGILAPILPITLMKVKYLVYL